MLSCQTGCCKACFILYFGVVSIPDLLCQLIILNRIMSTTPFTFYWTVILTDFIPTWTRSTKAEVLFLDCVTKCELSINWFPGVTN